ncbi:MAG: GGDEF domain-containing protein [candidate division Zixibacteria bacterium]|nr:GGDEF domain-containing protein [candidate division Zixibacteria bacterium]
MDSLTVNIILSGLVLILVVLLVIRQKQMKYLRPVDDLETTLKSMSTNLLISRNDGKIQKVAGQLSNILINHLKAKHILFFRRQKRFMEMNYVYGMKNIKRSKYRILVTNDLLQKMTDGLPLRRPDELADFIKPELTKLLNNHEFNLAFPIFWMNNLFGVYFIRTELQIKHPLLRAFLLFLNQNLSIAYQLTQLESNRRMTEDKYKRELSRMKSVNPNNIEDKLARDKEDPGHLVDMFSNHNIDDLMSNLFTKLKVGLKAEKLVFVSRPVSDKTSLKHYSIGMEKDTFTLDSLEFKNIFSGMQKHHVYEINKMPSQSIGDNLRVKIKASDVKRISKFSLDDSHPGVVLWTGNSTDENTESKLLHRLESIGRRAMVNAVKFEKMEEMSYTDSLTGLYNHRYFVKRLNEEIQRARRYNRKLGLLLFDIDDFKDYNDSYGHQLGDEILRKMGATLSRNLRSIDIVARYGGDEFCIIMPETDKQTCRVFMDRLLYSIANADFKGSNDSAKGRITISIGSAIFPDDAEKPEALIYCSDMALLHSKSTGRNKHTVYSSEINLKSAH